MPRIQALLAAVMIAAHLAVSPAHAQDPPLTGEQLCFEKGDWERGIPLLAKSQDFVFGELGRAELEPPTDLKEQMALADDWRKQAEVGPAQYKAAMRSRAIFWYRRALTQAKGPERALLVKAVDQLTLAIAFDGDDTTWTIPAAFAGRDGPARQKLLEARGGSEATEQAVTDALDWILRQQNADGSWNLQGRRGEPYTNPGAMVRTENGATALALLPLLARGHTHRHGEHKKAIQAGLDFLLAQAKPDRNILYGRDGKPLDARDGKILSGRDEGGTMYSHALLTLALVEAYALTGDANLRKAAQATVDYTLLAQAQGGGWRYEARQIADSSVTAWQVQALVAARLAGLDAPDRSLESAAKFLRSTRHGNFFGYTNNQGGSLAMAAGGAFALATLPNPDPVAERSSVKFLITTRALEHDPYYNYYANSLVLHTEAIDRKRWNDRLTAKLLESQSKRKLDRGSWFFEKDPYGESAGRLYCTSLCTLTLEAYYRYAVFAPVYKETAEAK